MLGQMDIRTNGQMDGQTGIRADGRKDGRADGWTYRQTLLHEDMHQIKNNKLLNHRHYTDISNSS